MGVPIKICGLTRLEDVLVAADLGAWALGFVFAPSLRRLTPAEARALIHQARERRESLPLLVGVFADAPACEIAEVAATLGLDAVQLHGSGCPGTASAASVREALASRGARCAARRTRAVPSAAASRTAGPPAASHTADPAAAVPLIIQAVPVEPGVGDVDGLAAAVAAARRDADLIVLDTNTAGRFGGTGESFPWWMARAAAAGGPFLVAGGVGPDNVRTVLSETGAWGVDVSSRVETAPGSKDPAALARLFANAGERDTAWAWPGARSGA